MILGYFQTIYHAEWQLVTKARDPLLAMDSIIQVWQQCNDLCKTHLGDI